MIISWKHKGLKAFYETESKAGIQPEHAKRLKLLLQLLDAAEEPQALHLPGLGFHPLQGDLKAYYALKVSGNWRLVFQFDGKNVCLVDYIDYH